MNQSIERKLAKIKKNKKYMKMAELYLFFGGGKYDTSDQSLYEMDCYESTGEKFPSFVSSIMNTANHNGYHYGKRIMGITFAMWREDVDKYGWGMAIPGLMKHTDDVIPGWVVKLALDNHIKNTWWGEPMPSYDNHLKLIDKLEEEQVEEQVEELEALFLRPELLLHPNIPKPLHGLAPRTLMKAKRWNEVRREAYAKNNYHCWACGAYREYDKEKLRFVEESLDCHEFYDIDYEAKTSTIVEFVALCKACHSYVHSGRMNGMYDKGRLNEEDCYYITSHGDRVLSQAGLDPTVKKVDENTYEDEWSDWKLVVDSYSHGSIMESYDQWVVKYKLGSKEWKSFGKTLTDIPEYILSRI